MKKLLCILFVLTAWGHTVSSLAQVRVISRTNDVRLLPTSQDTIYWFTGETVQYDIYARNGRSAVVISNSAVPMWYVTDSTLTNYFVMNTGTVVSATNGQVRFTLTPTYSALTSKLYQSAAIIYFQSPTNPTLQLVVDRTAADVRKSFSYAGTYRGPVFSTNGVLDGNTAVFPTFWTANATSVFAAISNLLPTSGGGTVDTNAVVALINASTNTAARLASNVWASADSTTNYALRSNGGISPVYGWQTSGGYDGSSYVNNFGQRIDFRTTNGARDVFNVYAVDTNQIPNNRGGLTIWAYGLAHTSSYSAGTRSPYWALGLHSVTSANQGVIVFTSSRGTNDTQHDTEFWNGSTAGGSKKVLTLSAEGHLLIHTGSITAAAGFIGDGSSVTNIGPSSLAASVNTNISARLASNVWAAADGTTNYARRTDTMTNNSFSINGVPVGSGSNVTISGGSGSGADTNSVLGMINASTNTSARLASNVWAAADSTTNYVRRTGGSYYTPSGWLFANQPGDTFISIGADSNIVAAVDASHLLQFNSAGFTLFNVPFVGDGSGLTALNSGVLTNLDGGLAVIGGKLTATNGIAQVLSNGASAPTSTVTISQLVLTNTMRIRFGSDTNSWIGALVSGGTVTQLQFNVGGQILSWP